MQWVPMHHSKRLDTELGCSIDSADNQSMSASRAASNGVRQHLGCALDRKCLGDHDGSGSGERVASWEERQMSYRATNRARAHVYGLRCLDTISAPNRRVSRSDQRWLGRGRLAAPAGAWRRALRFMRAHGV